MWGYESADSGKIGFVLTCLYRDAITDEEFLKLIFHIIEHNDDYPPYIIDLTDYKGDRLWLVKTIGFSTGWPFAEEDDNAIYGITYKRGFKPYKDVTITKEEALKKLEECPHVEKMFREIFPFIDF